MKKIDYSYSFIDKNTDIDGDFHLSIDLVVKGNIKGKLYRVKRFIFMGKVHLLESLNQKILLLKALLLVKPIANS